MGKKQNKKDKTKQYIIKQTRTILHDMNNAKQEKTINLKQDRPLRIKIKIKIHRNIKKRILKKRNNQSTIRQKQQM